MRRMTSTGAHVLPSSVHTYLRGYHVDGEYGCSFEEQGAWHGLGSAGGQWPTYALRSCEQVTIRFVSGAQSMAEIT